MQLNHLITHSSSWIKNVVKGFAMIHMHYVSLNYCIMVDTHDHIPKKSIITPLMIEAIQGVWWYKNHKTLLYVRISTNNEYLRWITCKLSYIMNTIILIVIMHCCDSSMHGQSMIYDYNDV